MVGIDIVEIERFKSMKNFSAFVQKICTDSELTYIEGKFNKYETVAGIFCAKEAVAKALGIGLSNMDMKNCEILHDEKGKPYVVLHNNANLVLAERNLQISISHSNLYATAIAVIFNR